MNTTNTVDKHFTTETLDGNNWVCTTQTFSTERLDPICICVRMCVVVCVGELQIANEYWSDWKLLLTLNNIHSDWSASIHWIRMRFALPMEFFTLNMHLQTPASKYITICRCNTAICFNYLWWIDFVAIRQFMKLIPAHWGN